MITRIASVVLALALAGCTTLGGTVRIGGPSDRQSSGQSERPPPATDSGTRPPTAPTAPPDADRRAADEPLRDDAPRAQRVWPRAIAMVWCSDTKAPTDSRLYKPIVDRGWDDALSRPIFSSSIPLDRLIDLGLDTMVCWPFGAHSAETAPTVARYPSGEPVRAFPRLPHEAIASERRDLESALMRRYPRAKSRGLELFIYTSPPADDDARAKLLDWCTRFHGKAFSGVALDTVTNCTRTSPGFAAAEDLLAAGIPVQAEGLRPRGRAFDHWYDGRFPIIVMENVASRHLARDNHPGPPAMGGDLDLEFIVMIPGSSTNTPGVRHDLARAWIDRGCSVIFEPGGMTDDELRGIASHAARARAAR